MDQPQHQSQGWCDGPKKQATYPALQKTRPELKKKKNDGNLLRL